jgi:Tfp pilus assembly protein PilF
MICIVLRRVWPSLALASLLLLTAAFFARACYCRSDIGFLAEHSPARWIIYPLPAHAGTRIGIPLDAIFRCSFSLHSVPATARLGVRVFRAGTIQLNGERVSCRFDADQWKQESRLDVARFLHAGKNEIVVTVTNASGPPALWLAVSCPETVLASDKSWEVSLAGATWLPAALAADPVPFGNIDRDGMAEEVTASIAKVWPMWLIFGGASAAIVWLCGRWLAGEKPWPPNSQESSSEQPTGGWLKTLLEPSGPHGRWIGLVRLLFGLIAVFWGVLFLHNSAYLAPGLGFDAGDHLAYINHFRANWSVPLPGQAWGMHHPPLYYFLVATLLDIVGYAPDTSGGILTIRLFNLVLALVNVYSILACLRLVFPEHPRRWVLGLLVAGFLPTFVYLYQYPLNHCLAGALASVAVYFVLRILCAPNASIRDYAFAGLALGSAILSIVSACVLVVPVGIALVAKHYIDRARLGGSHAARGIFLLAVMTYAVCGWYYMYVWVNVGTPIVANTGSGAGSPWSWWQDAGFHTGGDYLRFGETLRSPLFSAWYSVWDGLYGTLWGDVYIGGAAALESRPPWSYDYMVAGMWLALATTAAILVGLGAAIFHCLRKPTIVWSFLLAVAFVAGMVVLYGSLRVPYYFVKAFYGLAGAVPLCVLAALGFDLLPDAKSAGSPWRWLRGVILVVLGLWTLNVTATYWILPTAAETRRYVAQRQLEQGDVAGAIRTLKQSLVEHPDDGRARVQLAKLYLMQKLADPAQPMLKLSADQGDFSSRHFLMGILLAGEGRRNEAGDEFRAAMKLAPNDFTAAHDYAVFESAAPDAQTAIDAWRNVLRISPSDHDGHAALARLYLKAGNASSAERHEKYLRMLEKWGQQANARGF